ncbi:hypothetical protein MtrunA17_Chr1g0152181 [Medicago truncatula]|uniref:Uncharacterized protein n=1 Tax=Medicago truncatula TaxID=3880 RepID=A0A396JKH4_MEDTR|nr:hypothetical protein MtrunA17_Chr1g0152181 [Medicago truncatula]
MEIRIGTCLFADLIARGLLDYMLSSLLNKANMSFKLTDTYVSSFMLFD